LKKKNLKSFQEIIKLLMYNKEKPIEITNVVIPTLYFMATAVLETTFLL
jgi:predicted CopG family antitoxin